MKIKSFIKKIGSSITPKDQSRKDPVCGMTASGDSFKTEYNGKTYYFCSDFCKKQFLGNPRSYAE